MQDHDKSLLELMAIGAAIALGKMLVSDEVISKRLIVGRAVLGSASSVLAGLALLQFPAIPPLALIALGSAMGIVGAQFIEVWLKRQITKIGGGA